MRSGLNLVAAHQFKDCSMHFCVGDRANVRQSRGARFHGFDGLDGGFNLSKGPEYQRLIRQCPDSGVLPKAKRQVAVARGINIASAFS